MKIDLRSDTVTKPSDAMLQYMVNAAVGDDVFGEDPAVNELQQMAADMFGKESALFCPSGTMTNQIAIKCHTNPGDEVICEQNSHVYVHEGGGIGFNSGCQARLVPGIRGLLEANDIVNAINPADVHRPRTSLVCLENTSNRGGGACYNWDDILAIKEVCKENGLAYHLDGARLFNAIVAKGQNAWDFGNVFDSISICLSKGLGTPAGSLLLGNYEFINKARRIRKVFGGGMRQAGYLAAAGIFSFRHNIERLQQDHEHAKTISAALLKKTFVGKMLPVETNIIIFEVTENRKPEDFIDHLKQFDIHCLAIGKRHIRMVTHLDIYPSMIKTITDAISYMA